VNLRLKPYNDLTGNKETIDVQVSQNIVQRFAVWFGGSILGSNPNFAQICHSREAYFEHGPSICRNNALFRD
jgi:actin-related protein 3